MATIDTRRNKQGDITGYRLRACVGRDEQYKQVWRTCTIPRPEGLTPAKEKKEVQRMADEWEKEQKADYEKIRTKSLLRTLSLIIGGKTTLRTEHTRPAVFPFSAI